MISLVYRLICDTSHPSWQPWGNFDQAEQSDVNENWQSTVDSVCHVCESGWEEGLRLIASVLLQDEFCITDACEVC